jgi:phage/plasmid-associated DNA primase
MDFYDLNIIEKKDGSAQIRPDWRVGRSEDLMTRGGSFYAVWDERKGLWSTDIYDVQRLVDEDLNAYAQKLEANTGVRYPIARLETNSSKLWDEFHRFVRNSGNNFHNLDEKLIFADTVVTKKDYASRKLSYSIGDGNCDAWDTLIETLYSDEEHAKIEWAIGSVVSGDSKIIQKFLVFYGPPASGKSTMLNIIEMLFEGYTSVFDARELAGNNNVFATSAFKSNPLVAIQHDGDLSRIYDNTKLNSIVAHESMTVNEKYKAPYEAKSNAFLFMGTNVPVKISDAKSGIIRRLIDVVPTQKTLDHDTYHRLMDKIHFELGAIAKHCLDRYTSMGKNYYSSYRPKEMMLQTDVFYNFVEAHFDIFKDSDGISLKQAWSLYKEYCTETGIDKLLPQYKFREELKNYFENFEERVRIDGVQIRNYYTNFKRLGSLVPSTEMPIKIEGEYKIELQKRSSVFDEFCAACPAQYANKEEYPEKKWTNVTTILSDIDTKNTHYVKVPENHIVIDFDLVDENGNKDLALNLERAATWPPTYAEVSKSGHGLHLHYNYTGDVRELASVYDIGIEIKTLLGDSSLRRKLTLCNDINITTLDGGLPKKEKPLLSNKSIQSEKGLRDLIGRNLRKEIHPGTKPSIDFIKKILDEAYESGMAYDLRDMRSDILTFAAKSTNQSATCIKTVQEMPFVGQTMAEVETDDSPLVFFDVEVYKNLFVVCWKTHGSDTVVRMINPEPKDIEPLFKMKLVGFNNRRYDNHILYARYLGYSIEELYRVSQKLINAGNNKDVYFGEAYNISYTDIYDFSSKKQGLKRFMIDLDIHHVELDFPWDEPVDEKFWPNVEEYCVNDVNATEKVFEDRKQDFVARQILADLSGLSVNHTTQMHTAKIIFGDDKNPQNAFVYTDLSNEFKGYKFDGKESTYRGEITGEGGYVYAEPDIYEKVAVLDVASMHPTSIECLNLFGPYTERYSALKEARLAIKHKDYDKARTFFNGKLGQFLGDDKDADVLSYALKIIINIVYGLTSARFANPFRDNRNKDNIVAKRGALFMIDLKHAVQEKGFVVAHIKTDSIKIPDATPEIIDFVIEFGKKYGYHFEHEATYDWFCLVNDAVYIAREGKNWNAVGAQFQHPYVFKTLFTHEPLEFKDFCETKNVIQGRMYLDFSGTEDIKNMVHVGRTNSFVPVADGGVLWRIKDDKKYAVTGTKGYLWIDRDVAYKREEAGELDIDMTYFEDLKEKAKTAILQFGELCSVTDF